MHALIGEATDLLTLSDPFLFVGELAVAAEDRHVRTPIIQSQFLEPASGHRTPVPVEVQASDLGDVMHEI